MALTEQDIVTLTRALNYATEEEKVIIKKVLKNSIDKSSK